MAVSFAEDREWLCAGCGDVSISLTWLAVDLGERPDLRAMLQEASWSRSECAKCGGVVNRQDPLLVIHLASAAPVIVALPEHLVTTGPADDFQPVLDRVEASLAQVGSDAPGPLLGMPFDVLALAAARDVDADVASPSPGSKHPVDMPEPARARYAPFLDQIRESDNHRRTGQALGLLMRVTSRDDVVRLVDEFPEIKSEEAHREVTAWVAAARDSEERDVQGSRLKLLEAIAAGHLDKGWTVFEAEAVNLMTVHVNPKLERLIMALRRHEMAREWPEVIRLGEELAGVARALGDEGLEAEAQAAVADALLHADGGRSGATIEEAIHKYVRVMEILNHNRELDQPLRRAGLLLNLAVAYGYRVQDDPAANAERAIAALREVLELITMDEHGDEWAMAQTNLGWALTDRRVGDPSANVEEGIGHLQAALQWRSFERNPLDWAFTEINLGVAFSRRPRGDPKDNLATALDHYERSAQGFAAAGTPMLVAQALYNMASQRFALAKLDDTPPNEGQAIAAEAIDDARASLETRPLEVAPREAGRTWALLGDVLEWIGDREGAVTAFQRALEGLHPVTAPSDCRGAARSLASIAAELDNWALAAHAWEIAAEAAVAAVEARATINGRLEEIRTNINIFRWTAYALSRVGNVERAVELLELGRARELTAQLNRDTVELDRLGLLDPTLRDRFIAARLRLDAFDQASRAQEDVPLDQADESAASFRATVEEIRALPGLERFLQRPRFSEISSAARPGVPVAYVITAPAGSVVLLVSVDDSGLPRVDAIDVPTLTSTEVVEMLLGFDKATGGTRPSFLAAQAGLGSNLNEALEEVGEVVGQRLVMPLATFLDDSDATGVCLVPIGITGLIPLHTLEWGTPNGKRCLLDDFDVTFAPSAVIRSACMRRATSHSAEPSKLLVVGNPMPSGSPLPYSEFEAQMVAETLPATNVQVLTGTAATKQAVCAQLPGSTHVHLACHGSSNVFEPALPAALYLADDEPLSASELVETDGFTARLVVASACETGVIQGYETFDEVFGIATAFLWAGAAGVVSTLWAVDDLATSLLMSRFYELLAEESPGDVRRPSDPAAVLRSAQLWLRGLSVEEQTQYLRDRPVLRAEGTARLGVRVSVSEAAGSNRLYSASSFWAPFLFSGA